MEQANAEKFYEAMRQTMAKLVSDPVVVRSSYVRTTLLTDDTELPTPMPKGLTDLRDDVRTFPASDTLAETMSPETLKLYDPAEVCRTVDAMATARTFGCVKTDLENLMRDNPELGDDPDIAGAVSEIIRGADKALSAVAEDENTREMVESGERHVKYLSDEQTISFSNDLADVFDERKQMLDESPHMTAFHPFLQDSYADELDILDGMCDVSEQQGVMLARAAEIAPKPLSPLSDTDDQHDQQVTPADAQPAQPAPDTVAPKKPDLPFEEGLIDTSAHVSDTQTSHDGTTRDVSTIKWPKTCKNGRDTLSHASNGMVSLLVPGTYRAGGHDLGGCTTLVPRAAVHTDRTDPSRYSVTLVKHADGTYPLSFSRPAKDGFEHVTTLDADVVGRALNTKQKTERSRSASKAEAAVMATATDVTQTTAPDATDDIAK